MSYGAGAIAVKRLKGRLVDPRRYAVGSISFVYKKFPQLKNILPAMGYGATQIQELEETVNKVPCDVIVSGTPIDLSRVITANKPMVRVRYELQAIGRPDLADVLDRV